MVEKIDIIDTQVYCYNNDCELIKTLELSQFTGVDFTYLEGSKLFSLNISQPIKRTVKFSELQGIETNAIYEETLYENMTEKEKSDFDNLVDLCSIS